MPRRPIAPWPDAIADLQTGDLVFSRGTGWASRIIQWVTGSLWSHVAMVIEPGDIDPKMKDDGLLLWESTNIKGPDIDPNIASPKEGPMLVELEARLRHYITKEDTILFSVRYLHIERTPEMRRAIADFVQDPSVRTTKYPEVSEVIWYFLRERLLRGRTEKNFYCSELVAATYQAAGILPKRPSPQSYSPRDFSEAGFIPRLLRSELGQELHMGEVKD